MSHNSLAVLPGSLSSLSSLTGLRLNHNQLSRLPLELAALSSLVLFDARWVEQSGSRAGRLNAECHNEAASITHLTFWCVV